jgi:glycosyltransferase involved in cell wall biosynthesis
MGTTTHGPDFAMVAPALARIKQEFRQRVEIDIIGMTSGELPPGLNRIGLPNAALQSYPGFVNWLTSQLPGWHIGLAPLIETPFNLCKSPIKTMDYAAMGLAVLASDMPVYRGSIADGPAGFLVANDSAAWYAALNWLVRDEDLRRSIAAGARPAFVARATLTSQAERRRNALLGLLRTVETAA